VRPTRERLIYAWQRSAPTSAGTQSVGPAPGPARATSRPSGPLDHRPVDREERHGQRPGQASPAVRARIRRRWPRALRSFRGHAAGSRPRHCPRPWPLTTRDSAYHPSGVPVPTGAPARVAVDARPGASRCLKSAFEIPILSRPYILTSNAVRQHTQPMTGLPISLKAEEGLPLWHR
jgi:hypothetical protein